MLILKCLQWVQWVCSLSETQLATSSVLSCRQWAPWVSGNQCAQIWAQHIVFRRSSEWAQYCAGRLSEHRFERITLCSAICVRTCVSTTHCGGRGDYCAAYQGAGSSTVVHCGPCILVTHCNTGEGARILSAQQGRPYMYISSALFTLKVEILLLWVASVQFFTVMFLLDHLPSSKTQGAGAVCTWGLAIKRLTELGQKK